MGQRSMHHTVKLTHKPTGITAESRAWMGSSAASFRYQMQMARSYLAANLCRTEPPVTDVIRSYHFDCPLGIEPFIGHGRGHGREIAVGAEACRRVLAGEIPLPIRQETASQ